MMMKAGMSILAIVIGSLMVLPLLWPWVRRLSSHGRHYYNPDAHSDFIIGIGRWSVGMDAVVKFTAVGGLALAAAGAVGLWRAMK